jgi:hypothetical protein
MWVFDLPRLWLRSIFLSNPARCTAARRGGHAPRSEIEPLEERNLLAGTGLAGAYFARTNHTLAKFSRVDATLNLHWASGTPLASLGTDGFSVRLDSSEFHRNVQHLRQDLRRLAALGA